MLSLYLATLLYVDMTTVAQRCASTWDTYSFDTYSLRSLVDNPDAVSGYMCDRATLVRTIISLAPNSDLQTSPY